MRVGNWVTGDGRPRPDEHPPGPIKTDIVGCARCWGDGHKDLEFKAFTHPVEDSTVTHWAMCPTTNEPILMSIDE